MKTLAPAVVLVLSALTASGCSGSSGGAQSPGTTAGHAQASTSSQASPAVLERIVRSALLANHRLSVLVLARNQVPESAHASTSGPALASLRTAAATRRARGIRVRMLQDQHRVLSVQLDPSYARATAIVLDRQLVQPSRPDGRPLGHPVRLIERARYELRRLGSSPRFVVWTVEILR